MEKWIGEGKCVFVSLRGHSLKEQRNLKTQMMTEAKSKGKPYCKACRAHKDFLLGTVFNSSVGQLVRVLVTSFGKHGDFERCFLDSFLI